MGNSIYLANDTGLVRHNLTPAEHAEHTLRRKELVGKLYAARGEDHGDTPQRKGKGWSKGIRKAGSDRDQADKAGQDKQTVVRSRIRAEKIDKDVRDQIAHTDLDVGKELDALAKVPKSEQPAIVEQALAGKISIRKVIAERSPAPAPAVVEPKGPGLSKYLDDAAMLTDMIQENAGPRGSNTASVLDSVAAVMKVLMYEMITDSL